MEKKRILILGAGISGLSLAYFLSKYSDLFEITLLEKKSRCGGWIESSASTGFFFENGPRTFRYSKSNEILALCKELDLEKEIIFSPPKMLKRYLWIDGRLRKVPFITWPLIRALLTEWSAARSNQEDESVYEFACRRFNATVADHLFDPLVIGIYAGDMRTCSMRACFPRMKETEEKWGSLTKGYLFNPREQKKGLIAPLHGVETLVKALESNTRATFVKDVEVASIRFFEGGGIVNEKYEADYIFSALPCHIIGKLLVPELLTLDLRGTTVVNLGYTQEVLKYGGFGYIVSSKEQSEVLGVVFNSNTFPQQNRHEKETRLTVKLRRTDLSQQEAIDISLRAVKQHLGINVPPSVAMVIKAENAFPVMKVGHLGRMQAIEQKYLEKYPRLRLVGNYLYGVGVDDCIGRARSVAENFLSAVAS
jgi:oxygen-dependent protoporphyrinogen oxidase